MKQVRFLVVASLICGTLCTTQLKGQTTQVPIHEALKNNQLIAGSYETARDFFYNLPSKRDSVVMTYEPRDTQTWIGTFTVEPRFARSGKRVKKCWGFSSGAQAFIFHQIEFFPIETDDEGNLFFYGYEYIDNSGAVTAAVLGGAIGGAIHASAVESKAKKSKVKYNIDPNTGVPVHPLMGTNQESAYSNRNVVVYRSNKKENETEIQFLLDEKHIYSFVPGSYLIKPYGLFEKETKICVGDNFDRCTTMALPDEGTIWFRLSLPEVGNEIILEQLEDVDMFEYNKAANKQDKRGEQQPVEVLD